MSLCNKSNKSNDYDSIPYENKPIQTGTKIEFLDAEKSSKSLKKQPAKINLLNYHQDFQRPEFHSTKIEQSIEISNNPEIIDQFKPEKITSTFIQKPSMTICTNDPELSVIDESNLDYESNDSSNAYSNQSYASPILRRQFNLTPQSLYSSSLGFSQSCDFSDSADSEQFNSINTEIFDEDESDLTYACCVSYDAQIQGDLTLRFSERVKLLHYEENFSLVQNLHTKTCGYVPTYCIMKLSRFLRDFKYLNKI